MSKLEQMAAFIAVVEENSFVAAAKKCGISTAAISKQISRLEADLKIELLQRTTRHLSLTDMGAQYYQRAKKTLAELTEMEAAITAGQQEATGMLSIISGRYFAMKFLMPRLSEFMALNPKLHIQVDLTERFPNFSEENIDLVFGISMDGAPDLVRKRVTTTHYVLCASPHYLKKFGTPKIPDDLKKHRYITHVMRNPDNVITLKNNKKILVQPILWLNDTYAMREAAILGMGIVKLHDYVVADALADKQLIEILPNWQEPQQSVYLYYRQNRYLPLKIRRFIDFYTQTE